MRIQRICFGINSRSVNYGHTYVYIHTFFGCFKLYQYGIFEKCLVIPGVNYRDKTGRRRPDLCAVAGPTQYIWRNQFYLYVDNTKKLIWKILLNRF